MIVYILRVVEFENFNSKKHTETLDNLRMDYVKCIALKEEFKFDEKKEYGDLKKALILGGHEITALNPLKEALTSQENYSEFKNKIKIIMTEVKEKLKEAVTNYSESVESCLTSEQKVCFERTKKNFLEKRCPDALRVVAQKWLHQVREDNRKKEMAESLSADWKKV